jgi:hypothetical protein
VQYKTQTYGLGQEKESHSSIMEKKKYFSIRANPKQKKNKTIQEIPIIHPSKFLEDVHTNLSPY